MRATDLLEADHARVCDLLRRLETPLPASARIRVLDQIAVELEVHGHVEEEIFYPAVSRVSDRTSAARREHEQMMALLADLRECAAESRDFGPLLTALEDAVRHHWQEEEGPLFRDAERLGEGELERLGAAIAERRQGLLLALRHPARRPAARPARKIA